MNWGHENNTNQFGRARPYYATISFEELLKYPVAKYADENSYICGLQIGACRRGSN